MRYDNLYAPVEDHWWAKARLAKYFDLGTDVFTTVPKDKLVAWAERVKKDSYKLSWEDHEFLIGRLWRPYR